MKLHLIPELPNNNKGSLVIDVTYDDPEFKAKSPEDECPQVHWIESYDCGETFEVPDDIGNAILVKYKGWVSKNPWPEKKDTGNKTPGKNKMVSGASQTA